MGRVALNMGIPMAKKSIREGGIRVPFIAWGHRVDHPGTVVTTPIIVQDVFATVASLANVPLAPGEDPTLDSVSLVPYLEEGPDRSLREVAFVERQKKTDQIADRALTDGRYKLVQSNQTGDLLFDLQAEPWDETDLLAGEPTEDTLQVYERLLDAMPYPFEGLSR